MTLDTFVFPRIPEPPDVAILNYTIDDTTLSYSIPAPQSDSWYTLPTSPTEPKVKFTFRPAGVEETGRRSLRSPKLTVSPSVITSSALIRAEQAGFGSRALEVYDAAGNRVRTLVLRSSGGGVSATWNCDDDLGRRLPEGIYYCCLGDEAGSAVRKLILTR
jgi:hypothetical protein